MNTPLVRCCTRCGVPAFEFFAVANTNAVLCRMCESSWVLSAESSRLRAISASVFAEWVERLRCEENNERAEARAREQATQAQVTQDNKGGQ